jgi:hypothetical protein
LAQRYAFVEFTVHARKRMTERRTSEARVIDIIEHSLNVFWRGKIELRSAICRGTGESM